MYLCTYLSFVYKKTNIKTYLKNVVNLEPTEDVCIRSFTKTNHRKIYDILEDIIISYGDINVNKKTYFSEIEKIEDYTNKSNYKIISLFINLNNYCYGVLISSNLSSSEFYFPIKYSDYFSYTKYTIIYENILEKYIPTLEIMTKFVEFLNKIDDTYINPIFNLVNVNKQYIGFKSSNSLYYFFKENCNSYNGYGNQNSGNDIIFPYSVLDINDEILKFTKNSSYFTSALTLYNKSILKNRLYKYFISEFSSILRLDKNIPMRKKIIQIISSIKFDDSNSLMKLRLFLIKELKEYPNDLMTLKEIISKSIKISIYNPTKLIVENINLTIFDFDKQLYYRLRELDIDALMHELKQLLKDKITSVENDKEIPYNSIQFSNIYTSCSEKSNIKKGQCINNKLMIPSELIGDFYHMLCMDIKNPIKTKILTSLSSGIFDSMDFIYRNNEILDIYIEN